MSFIKLVDFYLELKKWLCPSKVSCLLEEELQETCSLIHFCGILSDVEPSATHFEATL